MQTQQPKDLSDKLKNLSNYVKALAAPYMVLDEDTEVPIKAGELAAIFRHLADDVDVMM